MLAFLEQLLLLNYLEKYPWKSYLLGWSITFLKIRYPWATNSFMEAASDSASKSPSTNPWRARARAGAKAGAGDGFFFVVTHVHPGSE